MSNTTHISSLIGDIYDAILDQSLWTGVLGKATQFIGAQAGALLWRNTLGEAADVVLTSGIEPHYVELYTEHYAKLDPTTAPMLLRDIGEVVSTTDLLPHSLFIETRFYREWVQPQGFVDTLRASLDKSATDLVYLSFMRNSKKDMADNAMRDRLRLIIPHMRRAVLVGRLIDRTTVQAATFGDALDRIGTGLFFVDASGQIFHANASGHALLTQGTLVRARGGRLILNDASAEQELNEILQLAEHDGADVEPRGVALPLTAADGEHYIAHVLLLTAGARRRAGIGYRAVAAVFVQKASLDMPSPQAAIAKFYKLTPTEQRVLFAIVEIGGVPEVAEAMGISANTVKTHLRRLFAKTGTDRQADLVKLVAGYGNPLVA